MTEWKTIEGFENYQISNTGHVRNEDGRILKPFTSNSGYFQIHLFKDKTRFKKYIHRLVAEAFCTNECGDTDVNHKDGDRKNNSASNLEWCSKSENMNHSCYVLMKAVKPVKCVETGVVYPSIHEAARITGTRRTGISMCCDGRQKTANKLHWGYAT